MQNISPQFHETAKYFDNYFNACGLKVAFASCYLGGAFEVLQMLPVQDRNGNEIKPDDLRRALITSGVTYDHAELDEIIVMTVPELEPGATLTLQTYVDDRTPPCVALSTNPRVLKDIAQKFDATDVIEAAHIRSTTGCAPPLPF